MSNERLVLENELFQKKVSYIKENKSSDFFPHLAKNEGEDRLLQLRIVDPDIACATLSFIMYGSYNLNLLPGFEWISTGVRNNGGFIKSDDVKNHLSDIKDQLIQDPDAFFKSLGLYDASTPRQVMEIFIEKVIDDLDQNKIISSD